MSITLELGTSDQFFVQTGLGADFDGRGTYALDQGDCSFDGSTTRCDLTGTIEPSGIRPFDSGTYDFVTTYAGSPPSPIQAIASAADPEFWSYLPFASNVSMSVELFTRAGDVRVPLLVDGNVVPGIGIGFANVDYACSGTSVATCSQAAVGLAAGAVGKSHVQIDVTFSLDGVEPVPPVTPIPPVPEPGTWALLLAGVGAVFEMSRRRIRR